MIHGIDPRIDFAFKRLFGVEGNRDLLIDLLNAVLDPPPEERIVEIVILNPFNEREYEDDKLTWLDIKARDAQGRWFNIEMQIIASPDFPQRELYYWARLHSQQLSKGETYASLRPTIGIAFVSNAVLAGVKDFHSRFWLLSPDHGARFTDTIEIHLVELSKFELASAETATPLDRWVYFMLNAAQTDTESIPEILDRPEFHKAFGELEMLAQDERQRLLYDERLKASLDFRSGVEAALEKGREEGRQEGRQEAREEGRQLGELIGQIRLCQEQLGRPATPRDELFSLTVLDLQQIASQLVSELRADGSGPTD